MTFLRAAHGRATLCSRESTPHVIRPLCMGHRAAAFSGRWLRASKLSQMADTLRLDPDEQSRSGHTPLTMRVRLGECRSRTLVPT